jgi:hypothetical protein
MTQSLPDHEGDLFQAIKTVRKSVAAPLAAEARHAARIAEAGGAQIEAVLTTLSSTQLPSDPLERLLKALSQHRYSLSNESDALRATAHSPCWAFNLLAVARPETFGLCSGALPLPGIVRRRLFRADLTGRRKRETARETMLAAMHETAYDIDRAWKAEKRFSTTFPDLRSNSRLRGVWLLFVGLGELTPAQVARAMPATRAGAGKLLRQLADANLIRTNGPFVPFACNPIPATTFAH